MIDFSCEIRELVLNDPFGLSRGTRTSVNNLFLRIENGWGEGAPIYYHGQDVHEMKNLAEQWLRTNPDIDRSIDVIVEGLFQRYPSQSSLIQAIDLALHDRWAKTFNRPLYQLWNLNTDHLPHSSFTIGLDSFDIMMEKVKRAHEFPILKIKMGNDEDLKIIEEIYKRTNKILYLDANEGWSLNQTLERLPRLSEWNVRLLEQPLPRDQAENYRILKENNNTSIPVFIDEGIHSPCDLHRWAGAVDGVNIKLAKCGGLYRAVEMFRIARQYGFKLLLGCMIESSLGITAAAQLAPLVDYLDLDGSTLIANDPFDGMEFKAGVIAIPNRPGLGAVWKTDR